MMLCAGRRSSSCNPVVDASLLFLVLSYVGPGQHFFVSTVCKLWYDSYASVPAVEVTCLADGLIPQTSCKFVCTPHMTLRSAIFGSGARVSLADQHLDIDDSSLARIAGRVANIATLVVAAELGMDVPDMMRGAAHAGCVSKLNFLEAIWGQHELPDDLCAYAASSGSEEALFWVEERGLLQTDTALLQAAKFGHVNLLEYVYSADYEIHIDEDVLSAAAKHGHLGAVEWLFEHDAPFNAERLCRDAAASGNLQLVEFLEDFEGGHYS
jgi:hypothetical protein